MECCWVTPFLLRCRWAGFPPPTWRRRTDFAGWTTSIQSRPPPAGDHAARPLSASPPRPSDLFDKTQRLGLKRGGGSDLPPQKKPFTAACWQTHTEQMSNNTFRDSDFLIWLLRGPVCPLWPTGKSSAQITPPPLFPNLPPPLFVLLLMTPSAGVTLAFTVIMLESWKGSASRLEHEDPADSAGLRYSSKSESRRWEALSAAGPVALLAFDPFVFKFLSTNKQ